ncbi:hypothetical protein L3C95_16505 [Chitinophaga filiformis]|uniref:hypothetical protein n=1 Tax=Chitinophaga filiformis TaxID=104663 RepID=UPI001F36C1AF|nr:hypothetical protein [Chitinophaga filiformis]MCF6404500.1 hypothetical protein [Chitinophaga filiformis]
MSRWLLLFIMTMAFSHCTPVNSYKKKYILICDDVDKTLISSLEHLESKVVQYLPDSCSDLDVKIYLTRPVNDKTEFSAFFSSSADYEYREKTLLDLIDTLKNYVRTGADYEEKAVINCLGEALSRELTDSTMFYELVMNTDLVENAGAYSSDDTDNDSWASCYFRFIKNNGECQPKELNEVKRQLDDPSSALYRTIIMPRNYGGKHWNIHLTYTKKVPMILSMNAGCDKREIQLFWRNLFNKIGITSSAYFTQLDEIPFFKQD